MNLNKGIFRIWIIVIPITWIVLYINSGIYYPNNSCDGREVERCSCIYTLEDKQKDEDNINKLIYKNA